MHQVIVSFERLISRFEHLFSVMEMKHAIAAILGLAFIYLCYLVIYGYFFCPTRHLPGPFLTRFTRGQYYFLLFGGEVSINVHKLPQKYGLASYDMS
jgi:hypothetical protein